MSASAGPEQGDTSSGLRTARNPDPDPDLVTFDPAWRHVLADGDDGVGHVLVRFIWTRARIGNT